MSNLFFREFGSGKPLIILHGLLGCSDNWIFHGKKLSNFFHVYILDQMNHGNSPHSSDISYDLLSDDIYEFIKFKKLSSVNIMGHSMGGKVAMSFALKHPNLVDNLIVLDIAPKDYSIQSRFDELINSVISLPIDTIESRKDADNYLSNSIPEIALRSFILKNLKRGNSNSFLWKPNITLIAKKMTEIYSWKESSLTYEANTLFIKGEKSDYISESDLLTIKKYFPNVIIKKIRNSGHWLHVDSPDEFFLLIKNFLKLF